MEVGRLPESRDETVSSVSMDEREVDSGIVCVVPDIGRRDDGAALSHCGDRVFVTDVLETGDESK